MKKSTLTEDKAEKTPTGGVLVGKRQGQTIIHNKGTLSGYLVGKTHAEGGIKAVNKSTGQPLEMQGGEVVITAPAVSDTTKRSFDGKMMTNREILSTINERGGGVAFAKDGMEIPKKIKRTGASYNYGGKTMTDHEIYKYITGGNVEKVPLRIVNKVKKLSDRILEIEKMNLGSDIYSYDGDLSFKERAKLITEQEKLQNELTEVTDKLSQEQCYSINSDSFKELNTAGDYGYEEQQFIIGGGISEDFSIRDIANIHQVPLSELKEEVKIGMIAESEHNADKKEQMEIVKDHLLENPKYYTLLKKAGLVDEKTAPLEKSKWLKQFYVTNNPSIDKLLKDLQPKINELIEKQKELVIKESTRIFGEPKPMSELDIQFYEAGLIFKMVQAFNKYLKNTDELYDVTINKRGSLFEVNGKVKRDGRTYKFDTELIDAGGYNIQEYHYRYIIKTDLPSSNENSAVENIKAKMGVLKKIKTIDEDIERYVKNIKNLEQQNIDGFYNINNTRVNFSEAVRIRNRLNIKYYKKEIEKLESKKSDLISVFESLDKKRVGVNFGKEVKEAIGRKILVDRLRGSKYKETGDTLDFKIESRSIRGAKIDERTYENLGTINTFSFVDEGNGLCTMKAGLELRGKYTSYAEYKNLPIKEIPYKINEIFNGEFSKYLEYNDGGEISDSESDYVKHLLDRNLETDLAEIKLKNYLQSKNIQSGMPLPDSIRKDEEYQKLKRDFDLAFSKMQKKPIYKNARNLDRVQRQKDLRRYKEILDDIINQKFKKGGQTESLVRDAKKGNTPARDLNNYNDVLDIDADGIVGAETGLYAGGGMMANGGLIAPNGKPSGLYFTEIYNLVRTPEFKAWFGDWEEAYITKDYDGVSKIIDENGEPLICVHNSPNQFFEFEENKIGSTTDAGFYGKGFYFFPNVGFDKYGENEYNCFLNIKNPYFKQSSHRNYELKSDELKNEGFDGVIVYPNFNKDFHFENGVDIAEEIVAYYSEQIKLADGTNTTFDSSNSDIRYELGGIFHGSPYNFDKFNTSKMGSGIGQQEDGWGIYLTDNKEATKNYGKYIYEITLFKNKSLAEYNFIDLKKPVKKDIVTKIVKAVYEKYNKDFDIIEFNQYYDYIKDKSLSKVDFNDYELVEFDYAGYLFYKTLSRKLGGDKNASLFLLDNGIDGLKRSFENSKGVYRTDYVIFDENAITIENKEFLSNNYYANGGKLGVETVLFAVRKGEPDYNEVLITNNPDKIEDAKKWALANGFDRLRVSKIDMMEKPDFKKTFYDGGMMANGGYLTNLSQKSFKTIDSNYMQQFGFYDFNWNKESQKENFDEWFTKFKNEQFKRNLNKVISLINEDIDLLEKRKQSDKKLKDFEELVLPTLGEDVKNPALSEYQEMVFMNPYATEEELRKALSDTSIFNEDGSINKEKITESEFFNEEGINLPNFERFVEKNPEYKGVFDSWKKMLDENMELHNKETNAFRYPSIADLKELKEELSNLDKTNYATGGNITQYDANMKEDTTDMMFADGGAVGSVVKNWNEVPSIWKDTSKVKKVAWTNSPYDKGLYSIVAPFLGKDELRPIFGGINFDDNGITVTNTYTLITLPYPNKQFEGTYEADLSKKPNPEQITIDGKYPNYSAIIPKQEVTKPFFIDVYKLLQYNNVAMKFANKYTNAVNYKIEDEIVGFNAKFLNENLKTLLKLGHETAYAHYMSPKNALLLSPNKDYEIGNDEIILTMPVMIQNKSYGAVDIDYKRELSVYYDFNDNEIHNADGSIAEFKMNYANNSVISKEDVNLLEKLANSRNLLQILNNVIVENGVARASDLETEFYLTGVDLPNGIYNPNKGALEITMEAIEDFPRKPIFVADENTIEFSINSDVLEYYVDKLKYVVGKDDLRPVMKGICLHHTSNNKLFLAGTDANILLKVDITEYVEMPVFNKDMKFIIEPKYLYDFLNSVENTSLKIKSNLVATVIESDNWSFYARNIDGNYPNYNAVIPTTTNKLANVSIEPIKKAFNSELVKNYVKESDKKIDIFIFNQQDEVYIANSERRRSSNPYDVSNIQKICETNVDFRLEEYYIENQSVLLIMPFGYDKQTNFSFRKDIVDRVIKIVNDNKLELHYTEFNRPYVIPIHSFEFKTTTKEHKLKEQKLSKKDLEEIAEIQNIVGVLEPVKEEKKYVIESKGFTEGIGSSSYKEKQKKQKEELQKNIEIIEIQEAIETLEILLETATRKDKKDINEAIEVLKMLLDTY